MKAVHKQRESGYALLLVIAMAGAIAMMLYQQLPRVAFESMRAKEEMLIERGEQYKRAIKLFVGKNKTYPKSIEDLEKYGGTRYLRRRYKDPFTGKDDWRLIHVENGRLTDSLVEKKEEKKANQNTFITENAGIGQTATGPGMGGVNVALRRRPSDGGVDGGLPLPPPTNEFQPQPPVPDPNVPQMPQQQQGPMTPQQQQMFVQQQLQQQQPGAVPPGAVPGMPQGMPGQQPGAIQPVSPQQAYPNGVPPYPGAVGAINPQTGQPYPPGQLPPGYPQPVQPGGQQPMPPGYPQPQNQNQNQPVVTGTTPNSALAMIQQQLTTPRSDIPMNLAPGMQLGGGIAGVASKYEGPTIKVYEEQQDYKKWEFIYDSKKDKALLQALGQATQQMNGPNPGGSNPLGGVNPPGGGSNPLGGSTTQNQNTFTGGGNTANPPGGQPPRPGYPPQQPGYPPQQPGYPPQQPPYPPQQPQQPINNQPPPPPGLPPGVGFPGRR